MIYTLCIAWQNCLFTGKFIAAINPLCLCMFAVFFLFIFLQIKLNPDDIYIWMKTWLWINTFKIESFIFFSLFLPRHDSTVILSWRMAWKSLQMGIIIMGKNLNCSKWKWYFRIWIGSCTQVNSEKKVFNSWKTEKKEEKFLFKFI